MAAVGKILLADDEQTFRQSTAELLRKEGYECDCVADAPAAVEKLKQNSYDLLIADIKMPGNSDLVLIKEMPQFAKGTPAILVTAFPSPRSAIEAVQLSVTAYMIKPIDFEELKKNVAEAVRRKNIFRAVFDTKQRLADWQKHIETIEKSLKAKNHEAFSASVRNFLALTMVNVNTAMNDVKNISSLLTDEQSSSAVCNLLNCPRLLELTEGLLETVRAIERTKSSFKSKELGQLRVRLEQTLKKVKKT
jgi:DNA-binding NtrC family response regulator